MNKSAIARLAQVNRSDVTNYMHSNERRTKYVSQVKQARIKTAMELPGRKVSKAQMVLEYLKRGNTLTPMQSLSWFGLHALSQTITRLRKQGYDIRNSIPEVRQNQTYAIYRLYTGEQK